MFKASTEPIQGTSTLGHVYFEQNESVKLSIVFSSVEIEPAKRDRFTFWVKKWGFPATKVRKKKKSVSQNVVRGSSVYRRVSAGSVSQFEYQGDRLKPHQYFCQYIVGRLESFAPKGMVGWPAPAPSAIFRYALFTHETRKRSKKCKCVNHNHFS